MVDYLEGDDYGTRTESQSPAAAGNAEAADASAYEYRIAEIPS